MTLKAMMLPDSPVYRKSEVAIVGLSRNHHICCISEYAGEGETDAGAPAMFPVPAWHLRKDMILRKCAHIYSSC